MLEPRTLLSDITVDLFADENDGDRTAGDVSLREAVLMANSLAGPDRILLKPGTYTLSIGGAGEDGGLTGDLDITGDLEVLATGTGPTVIDAAQLDRVFDLHGFIPTAGLSQPVLSLTGLTITGGLTPDGADNGGGGVRALRGGVKLTNTAVSNNRTGGGSFGGDGGGVEVALGTLTILNSTVTGNLAGTGTSLGGQGGGVAVNSTTTTITDSTISNNRTGDGEPGPGLITAGDGGGIYAQNANLVDGVHPVTPLTIVNSTVSGNVVGTNTLGAGGGIIAGAFTNVFIDDSTISGNSAYEGGGLTISGTLDRLRNSTVSGNKATGGVGGGGIYNSAGTLVLIDRSTISGNQAPNSAGDFNGGGGIFSQGPIGTIVNSTISGNSTNGTGGGLHSEDDIGHLINTTIANNSAASAGGLVHVDFSNVHPIIGELVNTIIADNTASGLNPKDLKLVGQLTTANNNLIEDPNGHTIANGSGGNIVGLDPKLGPLADNGGPTFTQALASSSPAINAGLNALAPAVDQRGQPRPFGAVADIGAYELQSAFNAVPIAANMAVATEEDKALNGTVVASDADGQTLTYLTVAGPAHGVLTFNSNGSFTYTPAPNYNGSDSFTFKANDGLADSTVATVTITVSPVNDAPVANGFQYSIDEDTALRDMLTASDVDGNTLTFAIAERPKNAAAFAIQANGQFTYLPVFNFYGSDSFVFSVSDGTTTSTATIFITVRPVNDAPFVESPSITADEDVPFSGTINSIDVEGDPYTFSLETAPTHGTATVNSDGTYVYTSALNYHGPDSFTFRATDDKGAARVGTATVWVRAINDAPVAADDQLFVDEDQSLVVSVAPISRLHADSEPGDIIGAGLSYNLTPPSATFQASKNFDNGASLTVRSVSEGASWALDFAAPNDVLLSPGVYLNAVRWPFQAANGSGLDVSVNGRGSNTLTGQFVVYDAAWNADKTQLLRFAAGFEQHSGGDIPGLFGTIQYNTTIGAKGGILANDSDGDQDLFTALLVSGPSHGTLTLGLDGSLVYTPDPNFSGTDSFTYKTNDGRLDSNVATVTINVKPINDAPVAQAQSVTTDEDKPLAVTLAATDVDGNPLTYAVAAQPAHGTLTGSGANLTYTPAPNYNGPDTFTFKANDGTADSNVVSVLINVRAVNDAPSFTIANAVVARDEDAGPQSIPNFVTDIAAGPATATDEVGQGLSFEVSVSASNGLTFSQAPAISPDGTLTYTTAPNSTGTATILVVLVDTGGTDFGGANRSVMKSFNILANGVNDAPTLDPIPDVSAFEDAPPQTVSLTGITAGPNEASQTLIVTATSSNPSLIPDPVVTYTSPNSTASLAFQPVANGTGTATITVIVRDSAGTANGGINTVMQTFLVTVRPVNDAPVAVNDSFTVAEDTALTGNVLTNDTDVEGDALTAEVVISPSHGSFTLNSDGSFAYTPALNFHGLDSFTYRVKDASFSVSNTATVFIEVTSVNHAPVAAIDVYATDEDTTLTVAAPGVLGNDSDVEGSTLTALVVASPAHGTLTLNADGSFRYTPQANYNGSDSFTYRANDGTLDSGVTTVNLTINSVNDIPTAVNDSYSVAQGGTLTGNVLTNDMDVEGSALTSALVNGPASGTLTLNPDGSFRYQPNDSFSGTDTFTYRVNDGAADSGVATVTIQVTPNNVAPVAKADSYSMSEDGTLIIAASGVLDNDTDADGNPLTAGLVTGPAHGTLTLEPDGSFTYVPTANYNGTDTFSYRANDGTVDSATVSVTIQVNAVNDEPLAFDDAYTVTKDRSLSGNVLANDSDVDGPALTASLVSGPINGKLTFNANGSFTYTPNANFSGTDTFIYRASDGSLSDTAIVTITVKSTNRGPKRPDATFSIAENSPNGTLVGALNGSDENGDDLTYTILNGNRSGAFAIDPSTGKITVADSSQLDYETTDQFTLRVKVSDPNGPSDVVTVTINLKDVRETVTARIDIKPGDKKNTIAINSRGTVEVAILGSAALDVLDIDLDSLRFGRTGREDSLGRRPQYRLADVNGDHQIDLIVGFDIEDLGFRKGDTVGILNGQTHDGRLFTATDSVTIQASNPSSGSCWDDDGDSDDNWWRGW